MYYSGSEESDLVSFFKKFFLSSPSPLFETSVAHFLGTFALSVFLSVVL